MSTSGRKRTRTKAPATVSVVANKMTHHNSNHRTSPPSSPEPPLLSQKALLLRDRPPLTRSGKQIVRLPTWTGTSGGSSGGLITDSDEGDFDEQYVEICVNQSYPADYFASSSSSAFRGNSTLGDGDPQSPNPGSAGTSDDAHSYYDDEEEDYGGEIDLSLIDSFIDFYFF